MIDLIPYVIILLGISAVSMYLIFVVIRKQLRLFKVRIEDENIRKFRIVLFVISMTIVVMGLIPVGINIYTLVAPTMRPPVVPLTSFIYSMGVHLQGVALSYLIWLLYKLADNETEITDYTTKQLKEQQARKPRK